MKTLASSRPAGQWFSSDETLNSLFPPFAQRLAKRHWTPLRIAKIAVDFLTPRDQVRILDIGSGIGKFCLSAAWMRPNAFFAGVEQRANLVEQSVYALDKLQFTNVSFMHGNFTQLNFAGYDHFYFFNSFYENLSGDNTIDDMIDYSADLYNYYSHCLYKKLEDMPPGTRVVTFHSLEDEIPFSYRAAESWFNGQLKCWIKE